MNTAAELPSASAEHALMRFEQPLNERMRTFLRVEFLYEQTLFHVDEPTEFSARAAVTALLEILTILGRSDVRTDVSKELERHAEHLGRYRSQPGVDPARLTKLIDHIDHTGNVKGRVVYIKEPRSLSRPSGQSESVSPARCQAWRHLYASCS